MNIFGVGGPELIAILIIMLVFAGPKRMIHWSYILGQYLAKFRTIWSQTVDVIQKEFDEAGVDVKLPKQMPTRQNLNKSVADAFKPMTQPLQDTIDEVKQDMDSVKAASDDIKQSTSLNPQKSVPVTKLNANKPKEATPSLGTWGGQAQEKQTTSNNGNRVDMGTWSSPSQDE